MNEQSVVYEEHRQPPSSQEVIITVKKGSGDYIINKYIDNMIFSIALSEEGAKYLLDMLQQALLDATIEAPKKVSPSIRLQKVRAGLRERA